MTRAPTASQLKKACEIARETETRITLPDGTIIEPVNMVLGHLGFSGSDIRRLESERKSDIQGLIPFDADAYGEIFDEGYQKSVPEFEPRHERPSLSKSGEGEIYFLICRSSGLIKIGYSADLKKRMAQYRTYVPMHPVLLGSAQGTMDDEASLHRYFGSLRRSHEWFWPHASLLRYISEQVA